MSVTSALVNVNRAFAKKAMADRLYDDRNFPKNTDNASQSINRL